MIVTINNNNSDKYLNLFTESYEYLKGLDNGYVDVNKERFSSLAEYYSHMADFFENQKYKYVMLPLDEEPFNIDLNTRTITVPTSFSKCASVQKDQLAETIVFVTDRYFDYMDLANVEIYVQWTIPENKKTGVEEYNGATRIEMIDLETEPGKIKFAWPLNDKITSVPGNVKFSVRFFRIDDSSPNKLLYSLNTLESIIIIKEALQPDLNVESQVEAPVSDDSFKKAILNSLHSTEGVIPPVQPVYFEPGSNISADTMIEVDDIKIVSLDNDTITLKVQAIVADAGEITYKWYYKDSSDIYYDVENYPMFDSEGNIIDNSFTTFGKVEDKYIKFETQPTERVNNERYYFEKSTGVYQLYTGSFPAEVDLFERYSTFTVPTTGNITGYYQAAAWNNIPVPNGYSRYKGELTEEEFNKGVFYIKDESGYSIATSFSADTVYYVNKVLTTLYPTRSDACLLPGPSVIAFKENADLLDGSILKLVDEDESKYEAILEVETVEDPYLPVMSYEWRTSTVAEVDVLNKDTAVMTTTTAPQLSVDAPGWYSVRVVSELNREKKYQFSNVCKVTHSPEPPVIEVQEHQFVSIKENPVTFSVKASVANPNKISEDLLNDFYTYIWQISLPDTDGAYVNISDTYVGISGVGTNSITITNKIKATSANFRCLVVNNLNGEKAVFDHSGSYADTTNSLGVFKAEAPYIYENTEDNFVFTIINY